jgi:DNA mismatch repair protein MutS
MNTPAMRQYTRFKAQYPDCVLFFRMGDFYEMFNEDAKLAHEVLGITLTERTHGIPMAGVPYHAVETYLRRMIEQGYRVAVCDQVQDPSEAKGIVDRAVTRVLTPGTLVDENLLEDARSNHLAALQILGSGPQATALLAVAELSTGGFTLLHLPPSRVLDELVRIAPSELLYPEPADGVVPAAMEAIRQATGCALSERPVWTFRLADAHEGLCRHFGVATLTGFGLDDQDPAVGVAGALLRYLQETQAPQQPGHHTLGHLRPPRRDTPDRYLAIDGASLRSLEIERTMRTGQTAGSLLSILQHCRTAMGKRLLRQWLCFPLRDIDAIESRQGAVATFIEDATLAGQLTGHLSAVQDVARIVGRVAVRRATPRDVVALGKSVGRLGDVVRLLADLPALARHHGRLRSLEETLGPLAEAITRQCVDTPPAHLREGGLFRAGVDEELDECHDLRRDAKIWLASYRQRLIGATGIRSLKVDQNKVFGYYIEVTHTYAGKVPASFSRKQTLKNAERYITPELKAFEDKVTTAESRAIEREKRLFDDLCARVADQAAALAEYAEIIAELDVLACFADIAQRYRYARPQLVEAPIIDIRAGRHPVLDRMLADRFVPNDCLMGRHEGTEARRHEGEDQGASGLTPHASSLCLITGPNMAGKSTYIRQTALIVLMAHTGSYVPAESATIGLADRIFTRIGASDELHAGQSTFMVEMTEAANILHHATDRSVVILDEIGRGTSTLDGLSLAWAIAECLAGLGCRTLFATHYHELTALADRISNVANLHVSVREWGEQVIFLYRILPGRTDRSYGIHVAKIAGLPPEVVSRAAELLETLAVQTESTGIADPVAARDRQMSLFTEYLEHPVVEALRSLNPETMTPLEAFDVLRRLSAETRKT